jgi:predicted transcriptional regulator
MSHESTTSVYLDQETKGMLADLARARNISRSEVVRKLILNAGSEDKLRLRELLTELSDLLDAT